jgi:hypothetical protein
MIFKISKEKFWYSSSGIEIWPEMLKTLPKEIEYRDKNKIAEEYFHMKKDEKGRLNTSCEIYGLFGGEAKGEEVTLTGCNLIRKTSEGSELTEEAVNIVDAYKVDENWEVLLMEQLMKYSLRIRAIVTSLLNGGRLYFSEGYLKSMSKAFIEYEDEEYFIFYNKNDKKNLNDLMRKYPKKSVGEFWLKEFRIENDEAIEIQGISNPDPSIDGISTQVKVPLVLLEYLGFIKEVDIGYYSIDKSRFKEKISKEVYESFLLNSEKDEIQILKELIEEYGDYKGNFPVEILGEKLKNYIEPYSSESLDGWIDKYFVSGFNSGKFKLISNEQGQPRHGRGLLGKRDHQLIKIEIKE